MTTVEPSTSVLVEADAAAYRALGRFGIAMADRKRISATVAVMLSGLSAESLAGVIDSAEGSDVADTVALGVVQSAVPLSARRSAATAAVIAAAQVLAQAAKEG